MCFLIIDRHTHNHFTAVWTLSTRTRVSWYQKKQSPTHTYSISHLYLLPSSIAIHGLLPVQFMCLTVFLHNFCPKFSLVYLFIWHPPLHTPYISSPNHCLLFAAHAHITATCMVTTGHRKSWKLGKPFFRPGKSWKITWTRIQIVRNKFRQLVPLLTNLAHLVT